MAGGLLLAGALLWFFGRSAAAGLAASGQDAVLQGACLKAGLVLGVLWLAWPQLERLPTWSVIGVGGLMIGLAVRPQAVLVLIRYVLVMLPIGLAIWLLWPKRARAKSGTPRQEPALRPAQVDRSSPSGATSSAPRRR
jgi:hypothetical protein